jgi:hypothetical protein
LAGGRRNLTQETVMSNMNQVLASAIVTVLTFGTGYQAKPSGPSEGIKVHGDWTIEARNPDGSVASRHQFKNALVKDAPFGGDRALVHLLTGLTQTGSWRVLLSGEGSLCRLDGVTPGQCDSGNFQVDPFLSPTTVSLSGTIAIPPEGGGTISEVRTGMFDCLASLAGCNSTNRFNTYTFSRKQLATSIVVVGGQTVHFKVVFSFS